MYKFRIDRYEGSQVITRLPFYPLDFFEYDGKRGRDAIRSSPRYLCQKGQKPLSRKELFKQFTCDIDLRHRVPLEHKGDAHPLSSSVDQSGIRWIIRLDPLHQRLAQDRISFR